MITQSLRKINEIENDEEFFEGIKAFYVARNANGEVFNMQEEMDAVPNVKSRLLQFVPRAQQYVDELLKGKA